MSCQNVALLATTIWQQWSQSDRERGRRIREQEREYKFRQDHWLSSLVSVSLFCKLILPTRGTIKFQLKWKIERNLKKTDTQNMDKDEDDNNYTKIKCTILNEIILFTYKYILICVCVCVCVYIYFPLRLSWQTNDTTKANGGIKQKGPKAKGWQGSCLSLYTSSYLSISFSHTLSMPLYVSFSVWLCRCACSEFYVSFFMTGSYSNTHTYTHIAHTLSVDMSAGLTVAQLAGHFKVQLLCS